MTDYSKLVEALRETATFEYTGKLLSKRECALENLAMDAAAAIEALQAQLPKRGEWIRVREVDIPGEMHPVAFRCMCSMCRNEYLLPRIPQYCPDCGSMNTAKMEVQDERT